MKTFKAPVKEDFGIEYFKGNELRLTPSKEYPDHYWILHQVTGRPTTDLVDDSLLLEITEITKAA